MISQLPKSGSMQLLTNEQIDDVTETLEELVKDPIDLAFVQGYIAALSFPYVPKCSDTYDMNILDFCENAMGWARHNIIESLDGESGALVFSIVENDKTGGDER